MNEIVRSDQLTVPNEISTPRDAIAAAAAKLEKAFPNMPKFTYDIMEIWRQQLGEFKVEWILSACDEAIGTEKFPPAVSVLRKHCLEYAHNERMESLYNEPDPFAEALGVTDNPVDVNRKLLRVQLAWMHDQNAKGETPKKIPFNSPEHKILKERIAEFDGVPIYQLAAKVRQVLGEN